MGEAAPARPAPWWRCQALLALSLLWSASTAGLMLGGAVTSGTAVLLFGIAFIIGVVGCVTLVLGRGQVRGTLSGARLFRFIAVLMFALEVPLLVLIRALLFGLGPPGEVVFTSVFTALCGALCIRGLLALLGSRSPSPRTEPPPR